MVSCCRHNNSSWFCSPPSAYERGWSRGARRTCHCLRKRKMRSTTPFERRMCPPEDTPKCGSCDSLYSVKVLYIYRCLQVVDIDASSLKHHAFRGADVRKIIIVLSRRRANRSRRTSTYPLLGTLPFSVRVRELFYSFGRLFCPTQHFRSICFCFDVDRNLNRRLMCS